VQQPETAEDRAARDDEVAVHYCAVTTGS
jgi:hypothetical protein